MNVSRVPLRPSAPPLSVVIGATTPPRANAIVCSAPSRATSTESALLSAFTTETPTPCSPLEIL